MAKKKIKSFKQECAEHGVDYWRALKRREAGLPKEKIFEKDYVRKSRVVNPITVDGITYPNLREAVRKLNPIASPKTISRWIKKGLSPEEAFSKIPNPGYEKGIVYRIDHKSSGKCYVGITIQTLERRWQNHIEQAVAGSVKDQDSLHEAIRRYGPDEFSVSAIDHGTTKKDIEKAERYWIKKLKTQIPNGFNIAPGGSSGGSTPIETTVDGKIFPSVKEAAEYVAKSREITLHAAKRRLLKGRIDIRTPAKPGESLVKTPAYKAWSHIIHGTLNPNSKDYIEGLEIHNSWKNFDLFFEDNGQPPQEGMAFSRINKAEGFFPGNCRWMTKSEASKINAAYMKMKGTLVGRRGLKKSSANKLLEKYAP